jgi:hypothetical protein
MKRVKEIVFDNPSQCLTLPAYDKTKVTLSKLMTQRTGTVPEENFVGPWPLGVARPGETTTAVPSAYPHAHDWSEDKMFVVLADVATAAATRRISCFEYNKQTQQFMWKGFITLTFPAGGVSMTIRGMRAMDYYYSVGTAAVSGTTVTGTGTSWLSTGQSVGARIGFGTTDPTQVTVWHDITAVNSNTSITVATAPGNMTNQPYVIDELRIAVSVTAATPANGGLFVAKGLHWDVFQQNGLTVPAATTVDNIRAVYGLRDVPVLASGQVQVAWGLAIDEMASWTQHECYVPNAAVATAHIFKFNMRAPLTNLVAGISEQGFVAKTGNVALVGALTQQNNGRVATLRHGPGNNIKCLYFVTTTRVYRVALTSILEGSTTWIADSMVENPMGSTTTTQGTGSMQSVEYSISLDRLIINGATVNRCYATQYRTDSGQFDLNWMAEHRYIHSTLSPVDMPPFPNLAGTGFSSWAEGGVLFTVRISATTTLNQMFAIPLGAEMTFSNQEYVLTPAIPLSDASRLYRVLVQAPVYAGNPAYSVPHEGYTVSYRTSGINDNTGSWVRLGSSGDLAGVMGTEIQFRFDFRVLGSTCIPARIHSLSLVYEDNATEANYEPSVLQSNLTTRTFSWRQTALFPGGTLPNLRVRLYDVSNTNAPALLMSDHVNTPSQGTWQFSANGGATWQPWQSNANAIGNFIRFTPNVLPTAKRLRALLTL